jgi:ribosomal protein S4E
MLHGRSFVVWNVVTSLMRLYVGLFDFVNVSRIIQEFTVLYPEKKLKVQLCFYPEDEA